MLGKARITRGFLMRRFNLALIAITAGLGFSTAAVASDAPASGASNSNGAAQTAKAQRATPRKAVRRFSRAGTSTAGAHGFLPGVTFLSAVFAGTSVAATASGFDFSLPTPTPASPE